MASVSPVASVASVFPFGLEVVSSKCFDACVSGKIDAEATAKDVGTVHPAVRLHQLV